MKRKVLPLPELARRPRMVRPSARPAAWRSPSPSPVPPYFRVVEASACWKAWNRRADLLLGQADAGVADRELDELAVGMSSSTSP